MSIIAPYMNTPVIRKPALGCKCPCHRSHGDLCINQDCCEDHWQRPDQYNWDNKTDAADDSRYENG